MPISKCSQSHQLGARPQRSYYYAGCDSAAAAPGAPCRPRAAAKAPAPCRAGKGVSARYTLLVATIKPTTAARPAMLARIHALGPRRAATRLRSCSAGDLIAPAAAISAGAALRGSAAERCLAPRPFAEAEQPGKQKKKKRQRLVGPRGCWRRRDASGGLAGRPRRGTHNACRHDWRFLSVRGGPGPRARRACVC